MSMLELGVAMAGKVYVAYKVAPIHISEDALSLQNRAVQHFQSNPLSDNDRQLGQNIFKGCQSVLVKI